jgi:predicted DNA-binding WGR domain protein
MARFYAMSIEPTLFGDTSLVRNWGRIGTRGQRKIELFENSIEARGAMGQLAIRKARRGYQTAKSRA